MAENKAVHTIVLDSGPLIKNDPSVSSLIRTAHKISTIPQVLSEIRDENTRSRLNTLLKPFLEVRSPRTESIKFITDFARRTGDLAVLSRTDLLLLALTYEIECERNGGDWRLRRMPGQKERNGDPPKMTDAATASSSHLSTGQAPGREAEPASSAESTADGADQKTEMDPSLGRSQDGPSGGTEDIQAETEPSTQTISTSAVDEAAARLSSATISDDSNTPKAPSEDAQTDEPSSDSDSGDWITPSNLTTHQAKDASAAPLTPSRPLEAAILTSDYAMQRIALQVGLDLLSPALARIRTVNSYVQRCHACFLVVKDSGKQFCPRCGQAALTRVACSTNAKGEFKLHFKKNFQYNKRGDRFSIPKPVGGSASGKINVGGGGKGGGKGGWGTNLILAEDQKEYTRAVEGQRRAKERDLLDEDFLPGILSGERRRGGGRPRVGAGRNVNSRKGR